MLATKTQDEQVAYWARVGAEKKVLFDEVIAQVTLALKRNSNKIWLAHMAWTCVDLISKIQRQVFSSCFIFAKSPKPALCGIIVS